MNVWELTWHGCDHCLHAFGSDRDRFALAEDKRHDAYAHHGQREGSP
jgi:hypothetical protein